MFRHTEILYSVIALAASLLGGNQTILAQLSVDNLEEYEVIQRATDQIPDFIVSGTCKEGTESVHFSIAKQHATNPGVTSLDWKKLPATIEGTSWASPLKDLPVGGEYKFLFRTAKDARSLVSIEHILVGDVWLAAGQSNMQQEAPANADPEHVHVRSLHSVVGAKPSSITENGTWGNGNTPGPAMTFASKYHELTGVPVGILHCVGGGTALDQWYGEPKRPLFTMMAAKVQAVCNFRISGLFWYQGESEDNRAEWATSYYNRFLPMRDELRERAKNPSLPILVVQLESWDGESDNMITGKPFGWPLAPNRRPRWPVIRDHQERIGAADRYSATVPAIDFGGLHIDPKSNGLLGERAAKIALGTFLDQPLGTGPLFEQAWFISPSRADIIVQLKNVTGSVVCPEDPNHLGFFVMRTEAFDIGDAAIFDHGDSAPMLEPIQSIETLSANRIKITLEAPPQGLVTIGYGSHINLMDLDLVTDDTGIPLCAFFDRPIADAPPAMDLHGDETSDPVTHLFLLLGQSNMAGFALAEEPDKRTNERILTLGYDDNCGRQENEWMIAAPPLHDFINGCEEKVSPGDWFAKTIIENLPIQDRIGLVPAAFSGRKIETFLKGGQHHETIIRKIAIAAKAKNARFAGILFHQGESNNGDPDWPGNVRTLYDQLTAAMEIDHDIPFIAGELLYSGGCAGHNELVRTLPELGDNFHYVSAKGLEVDGNDARWKLHFGHDATVELGKRYAVKMLEVLNW